MEVIPFLIDAVLAVVAWEIGKIIYYTFFHNHKDDEWKPNKPSN